MNGASSDVVSIQKMVTLTYITPMNTIMIFTCVNISSSSFSANSLSNLFGCTIGCTPGNYPRIWSLEQFPQGAKPWPNFWVKLDLGIRNSTVLFPGSGRLPFSLKMAPKFYPNLTFCHFLQLVLINSCYHCYGHKHDITEFFTFLTYMCACPNCFI